MKNDVSMEGLLGFLREEIESLLGEAGGARGIGEAEGRELLHRYREELEGALGKFDPDVVPQMGVGTRGVAFGIGDGIFKLTRDATEAEISAALVGNDNPNLTRYHEVVQFGDSDVYGIYQEKLEPLSDAEVKRLNRALVVTRFPVHLVEAGYDFDAAKVATKEYMRSKYREMVEKKKFREAEAWLAEANSLWNVISREYNIRGLAGALQDLGIQYHDYHGGNFMKRGDDLVLIDLGNSTKVPGGGRIRSLAGSKSPAAGAKVESRAAMRLLGEARIFRLGEVSRPAEYRAPEGSKRDKGLDKTAADLASGDPERVQRAYRRRDRMEKAEREKPGWKNRPRPDSAAARTDEGFESLREVIRELVGEALSKKTKATLRKKAEKRGLTPGSVEAEYKKGLAAWATSGSRPGMSQHQWAMARVNAATPSKSWATVKKSKRKKKKG